MLLEVIVQDAHDVPIPFEVRCYACDDLAAAGELYAAMGKVPNPEYSMTLWRIQRMPAAVACVVFCVEHPRDPHDRSGARLAAVLDACARAQRAQEVVDLTVDEAQAFVQRRINMCMDAAMRCVECGELITPDELRRLTLDTDFVEHGDRGHLIRRRPKVATATHYGTKRGAILDLETAEVTIRRIEG